MTHSVSDKVTYWAVLDSLKSLLGMYSIIWIWLQDDLDTRASKLRSQKWSRYHLRGSDWKVNPFLKGSRDCAKSCSNRQKSPFFSKAGETAILNCSFYLHSDDLYSVKWYKVNFSSFLSNSGPVIAWFCHWLSGKMNTWSMWCWKVKGAETKEIADVDLLLDNLVTPC